MALEGSCATLAAAWAGERGGTTVRVETRVAERGSFSAGVKYRGRRPHSDSFGLLPRPQKVPSIDPAYDLDYSLHC